jgi:hypothetical protein
MGGGDDVTLVERAADADRDGLLADRHVEEAGQLAGPEPLLDLLLEAPDDEHLAEQLLEPLRREGLALLLHCGHAAGHLTEGGRPSTLESVPWRWPSGAARSWTACSAAGRPRISTSSWTTRTRPTAPA